MQTDASGVELFLQKCDEVMQSKFIIADTKIGELLQAIAASDLLYAFFRDITKDFDYPAAKSKYMNYAPYGKMQKKLLFPDMPHLSRNPCGKQCFWRQPQVKLINCYSNQTPSGALF